MERECKGLREPAEAERQRVDGGLEMPWEGLQVISECHWEMSLGDLRGRKTDLLPSAPLQRCPLLTVHFGDQRRRLQHH